MTIPYRGSKGPLHLLVPSRALLRNTLRAADNTGIKAGGEGSLLSYD